MRKATFPCLLILGLGLLVAPIAWMDDEKEEPKEPDKVESLHDAMEGVGAHAKKIGNAFRDKKHDKIEGYAGKMGKYIAKAIEQDLPELVKTEEDEEKFKGFLKSLEEWIAKVQEAAGKKDYKEAKKSFQKAGSVCGKCHNKFRPKKDE